MSMCRPAGYYGDSVMNVVRQYWYDRYVAYLRSELIAKSKLATETSAIHMVHLNKVLFLRLSTMHSNRSATGTVLRLIQTLRES